MSETIKQGENRISQEFLIKIIGGMTVGVVLATCAYFTISSGREKNIIERQIEGEARRLKARANSRTITESRSSTEQSSARESTVKGAPAEVEFEKDFNRDFDDIQEQLNEDLDMLGRI